MYIYVYIKIIINYNNKVFNIIEDRIILNKSLKINILNLIFFFFFFHQFLI